MATVWKIPLDCTGGWILCSLFAVEIMEKVLTGGPWFVNGHIVGMDRWNPSFNPNSLKGLVSPIWIRMPNLPLYCWDETNVSRIASKVGKPLLIDGYMFQWGRREFARICVRVELDKKLPLGVWVEGREGRFFQKVEYEKISSLCFQCGKIGHVAEYCPELKNRNVANNMEKKDENSKNMGKTVEVNVNEDYSYGSYGPWILVNNKRSTRRTTGARRNISIPKTRGVWKARVDKAAANQSGSAIGMGGEELFSNADLILLSKENNPNEKFVEINKMSSATTVLSERNYVEGKSPAGSPNIEGSKVCNKKSVMVGKVDEDLVPEELVLIRKDSTQDDNGNI
ncbi:hypothetical protein KFK09_003948 [Dendrobium nobile]|uniref:CCHC-type domain-containing protein n=1 Tax=Dendrobium nobile TaxID=94219 RepID=A0A8T3C4K8_DENNO|nr:hypothetical protein KFK09_003948 [Dendrobium nobile]